MTVLDAPPVPAEVVRGLRVPEYDALVATGVLDDERVELVEGVLVRMRPQRPPHAAVVANVLRALNQELPDGWMIRPQLPFVANDRSEPEPDIAIVADADYMRHHPSQALLLVEVAHTSQRLDLGVKARVYAATGVGDYWVVDTARGSVHVHRGASDSGYAEVTVHEGGTVRTSGSPMLEMDVDRVLGRTTGP